MKNKKQMSFYTHQQENTYPVVTTILSAKNPCGHSFTALKMDVDAKNKGEVDFGVFIGF